MSNRVYVVLCLIAFFAASPALAQVEQPITKHWGPYTIQARPYHPDDGSLAAVTVNDASGLIVKRYQNVYVDQLTIAEVNGLGTPELVVGMRDGSTGFCADTFVLTRDGGVKTLLHVHGTFSFEGLSHHGGASRPLLLFEGALKCDGLAMEVDLPNAVSPEAPMVVGWDGRHYVNQTTRFPARSLRMAAKARAAFLEEPGNTPGALEYYVNMVAAGREAEARRFILRRGDRAVRVWFLRHERKIRSVVNAWLRERYS